jgi:AsmA-like C-terminal region/AsmA family
MRKSYKFVLLFLIAFTVMTIVFIQAFNRLASKNREQIHQELQRFLGKDATFDQLEASLWGGLGFSAKEFRIADNPRFAATPAVRAKDLKLGVSLIQLLLGRVVVNSLTLEAPEFQIITDERGLLNLAELAISTREPRVVSSSRTTPVEKKPLGVSFLVTKVKVKNGRIDFIDRSVKEPAEIRVKNVEMELKGFNPAQKIKLRLAAAMTEGIGHDVKIDGQLGPLRQNHDWSQQPVELEMRFDSLSVTLLSRALPFLRNRIPRELDVTGPLALQANLAGTFSRPRITDIALRIPLFGSSNYNAILEGSMELPEGRPWAEAQLNGKLTMSSINLSQLRNLPFLVQNLPAALAMEGSVNAYSRFEGSWANLRAGVLIKAEKSQFRYGEWLRKPANSPAELRGQISRQKNGLTLHESVLNLGHAKLFLSGVAEETPTARLQLRLRSDESPLASWGNLVSPLSFHGIGGTAEWDVVCDKDLALANGWRIHGKLRLADAELRQKESGRKIDHLSADVSFLGKAALSKDVTFQLGSSRIALAAHVADINQPSVIYELRSAEFDLRDLPIFAAGKHNRIRNIMAKGEIQWQDGLPWLKGTIFSSEGSFEDISYRNLQGDVTWSSQGIDFKNLTLSVLDGKLRSDGHWAGGAEQPKHLTLAPHIESMDVGAFLRQKFPQLKNRVDGQLNLQGQFDVAAHNGTAVAESLRGSGESVIHQGTIRDFNLLAKIIPGGGDTAFKGTPRLPESLAELVNRRDTPFETLKASFKIDQKRVRTDDLLLITPEYTISGAGWIGFDRTTQWNGLLVLSPRITQELQREYKLIRHLLDRRGRLSVSFRAEGKFPKVKLKPENRALAQVLRRGLAPRAGETGPDDKKSAEKEPREGWLPQALEELLKP